METEVMKRTVRFSILGSFIVFLLGCEGSNIEYSYPRTGPGGIPTYEKHQSIFGSDGITLFQNDGGLSERNEGSAGIGVNSFLWRAALDTIAFMPLVSADPFGGVIITDWYAPPGSEGERFKINLFILGKALRSDGVRAKLFKQVRASNESWIDSSTSSDLDRELEDSILTRARQLRISSAPQVK
tara:strand:+ start:1884 stop:2438 length:555 start_codon:yes stop_codon:yes gene_type:complete